MRHTAVRFKILVPWMVGMMMGCILLVLPTMFGLVFLAYGTSAPYVFDLASKLAVVAIVYSFLFAITPVFQVNMYLDAFDRARYLRTNVVAGWWLMKYANLIGICVLLWRGLAVLNALRAFAWEGMCGPDDRIVHNLPDPES